MFFLVSDTTSNKHTFIARTVDFGGHRCIFVQEVRWYSRAVQWRWRQLNLFDTLQLECNCYRGGPPVIVSVVFGD